MVAPGKKVAIRKNAGRSRSGVVDAPLRIITACRHHSAASCVALHDFSSELARHDKDGPQVMHEGATRLIALQEGCARRRSARNFHRGRRVADACAVAETPCDHRRNARPSLTLHSLTSAFSSESVSCHVLWAFGPAARPHAPYPALLGVFMFVGRWRRGYAHDTAHFFVVLATVCSRAGVHMAGRVWRIGRQHWVLRLLRLFDIG